jgi:hypothetical protein
MPALLVAAALSADPTSKGLTLTGVGQAGVLKGPGEDEEAAPSCAACWPRGPDSRSTPTGGASRSIRRRAPFSRRWAAREVGLVATSVGAPPAADKRDRLA